MATRTPPDVIGRGPQRDAWLTLNEAMAQGLLSRPDACTVCGAVAPVVAHHWRGYHHALDVWWVCRRCNNSLPHHDGSVSLEQARRQMASVKTDNTGLGAKLALRRHFLTKYHADRPPDVVDCCQGDGVIWGELRREFATRTYLGVDQKPKPGRMKINSIRLLSAIGWTWNVVDIDTYGAPWAHWLALLRTVTAPVTVFLTVGRVAALGGRFGTRITDAEFEALGLWPLRNRVPIQFGFKLGGIATGLMLSRGNQGRTRVVEAAEALSSGHADYLGVRLDVLGPP